MNRHELGPEEAPKEAHSRVIDAGRFLSLPEMTIELIRRLEVSFDVGVTEGYRLDPELEGGSELARPSIVLTPRGDFRAPITFVFTAFPGVITRFGRWYVEYFPTCGCDACGSDGAEEFQRLNHAVADIVSGRFRESITVPRMAGDAEHVTEFWSSNHTRSARFRLERSRAEEWLQGKRGETVAWMPWQRHGRRSSRTPYAP